MRAAISASAWSRDYSVIVHRVVWATIATRGPMGQQRYESEIQAALLRVSDDNWSFERLAITSVRSDIRGDRRFPSRLWALPLSLSRLGGRFLYGNPQLVHRFDLRLPAAYGREVVTVHDLPPLHFPDEGRLARSALAGARRAVRTIVPSQFAASELVRAIGRVDIDVIPYGVSADYIISNAACDDELAALGMETPFILHAAGATSRKNLEGLADAWRTVSRQHPDVTLVLCGPSDARRDRAFNGLPRVVKPGWLDPSIVASVMRRATLLVVPSIYEGFGLPALEGMACGVPVVAACRGALPEICGNAALLVEPDGASLAKGIDRVLTDETLAKDLRHRGPIRAAEFDWDVAAREHLRVYREALG